MAGGAPPGRDGSDDEGVKGGTQHRTADRYCASGQDCERQVEVVARSWIAELRTIRQDRTLVRRMRGHRRVQGDEGGTAQGECRDIFFERLTYDSAGNQISDTFRTYTYDA